MVAAALNGAVAALTGLGQWRYDRGRHSRWVWLLAPLWFWPYPVLSWAALAMRFLGGVRFGNARLWRVV
jgi:hypothetical protein